MGDIYQYFNFWFILLVFSLRIHLVQRSKRYHSIFFLKVLHLFFYLIQTFNPVPFFVWLAALGTSLDATVELQMSTPVFHSQPFTCRSSYLSGPFRLSYWLSLLISPFSRRRIMDWLYMLPSIQSKLLVFGRIGLNLLACAWYKYILIHTLFST